MHTFPLLPLGSVGRSCFAAALVFFGLEHLLFATFVTRIIPEGWPFVGRQTALLLGGLLVGTGVVILLRLPLARRAALGVGWLILIASLFVYARELLDQPRSPILWTSLGKALVIGTGCWLVAASLPKETNSPTDRVFVLLLSVTLGAFLVGCGYEHFLYAGFVQQLVPAWIPGPRFWTYFGGVALIAGGIGINVHRFSRTAALLSGIMILSWFFLLHLPRAYAEKIGTNESTASAEALAIGGLCLLLRDTRTRQSVPA